MNVFDLSAKISLDSSEYTKALDSAAKQSSSFGSKLATGLGNTAKVATAAIAGLSTAAAGLGAALYKAASSAAETGDHIDKMSQKIGISTDAYQEWSYVMELCGGNVDQLQGGMKTLSKVITDAGNGADNAADKLAAVGLSIEDLTGLSQEEQLQKVVVALQGMGEGAERTAAASALLGRSATELGPLLNMSAEEMEKLKDEAHKYGMVMSDEVVKNSAAFKDALTKLSGTFKGLKTSMVSGFLPGITQVVNGFSDLLAGIDGADEKINEGMRAITKNIEELTPKLGNILGTVVPAIVKALPSMITSLGKALVQMVPKLLPAVGEALGELVSSLSSMIPELLPDMINFVVDMIEALINGIPSFVEGFWTFIENIFSALASLDWSDIATRLLTALQTALTKTGEILFGEDHSVLDSILSGIESGIGLLADTAIKLLSSLAGFITENLPKIVTAATSILTKIIETITEHLPDLLQAALDIIESLATYLLQEDVIGSLIQAAFDILGKLVEFLMKDDTLSQLVDAAVTIITNLVQFMVDHIDDILDLIISLITKLGEALTKQETLDALFSAATTIVEKLIGFMAEALYSIVKPIIVFAKGIYDVLTGNATLDEALEKTGKAWGESILSGLFEAILVGLEWLGDLTGNKTNTQILKSLIGNLKKSGATGEFSIGDVFNATAMDTIDIYGKNYFGVDSGSDGKNFLDNKVAVVNYNTYVQGALAETADQAYQEAQAAQRMKGLWSTVPTSARSAMAKG